MSKRYFLCPKKLFSRHNQILHPRPPAHASGTTVISLQVTTPSLPKG